MKGELLLSAGAFRLGITGMDVVLDDIAEDHQVVGTVSFLDEVDALAETGVAPTVALVRDYIKPDDTRDMVARIKSKFPSAFVAVVGAESDTKIEGADHVFGELVPGEIKKFLLELKHDQVV